MKANPTWIAREALRQLVTLKLPPTPENYTRLYHKIDNSAETAQVEHGLVAADPAGDADADSHRTEGPSCRDLLVAAILSGADVLPNEVGPEAHALAAELQDVCNGSLRTEDVERVRRLLDTVRTMVGERMRVGRELLALLQSVANGVVKAAGETSWIGSTLLRLAPLHSEPVTAEGVALLQRGIAELLDRQRLVSSELDDAKQAMKQMVTTFISQMGQLAANTDDYQNSLARYAAEVEHAQDIKELSSLIVHVMEDTRGLQADVGATHAELVAAQRRAEEMQERAKALEQEMIALSDDLQTDLLTHALNRRGLDTRFDAEASRSDRHDSALSLVMFDVDNFKALNDRLGHQGGDAALVHLTSALRDSLRKSDVVARYGGDEFVILLPETNLEDAMKLTTRIQRDLTRHFFLYENQGVLVTFSAGVAQRAPGESREALLARADKALYDAKRSGKNRVVAAVPVDEATMDLPAQGRREWPAALARTQ